MHTLLEPAPALDVAALNAAITPTARELIVARRQLHFKALMIGLLVAGSYLTLVVFPAAVVIKVIAAFILMISLVSVATSIFHDGNHSSFSRSKLVNRLAGYTGDLMGASSWIWRFKHNNLHHGNTNVDGFDDDINQSPFARLTPEQRWRPWHRYQHLYMWVLYGFLTLRWFLIGDFNDLHRRRAVERQAARPTRRRDVAMILVGKALHISWAIALPLVFHSWWVVLTFYVAISWTMGVILATMFQLAHCTAIVEFPGPDSARRGADFVEHQLRTTADVHCRTRGGQRVLGWFMGGLECQIEHHLTPKLPHTVYPLVQRRLGRLCADLHVRLRSHPTPWQAVRAHALWLRAMGVRPTVVA